MNIIRGLSGIKGRFHDTVVAIGTFDGIHRGHQAIIKKTVMEAGKLGSKALVVTFNMNPVSVLKGSRHKIFLISTPDIKKKVMKALKVDIMVVVNFTSNFARMSPEKFIKDVICGRLNAAKVVVGGDFRFGRSRKGTVSLLKTMSKEHGFKVYTVPAARFGGEKVSSTRIRKAILSGNVKEAARLIGRYYTITGKVMRGDGRGKRLSFPTANIKMDSRAALKPGVYKVRVDINGVMYSGVANVGYKPTFRKIKTRKISGKKPLVEVHVFRFSGNLYGRMIGVSFIEYIRPEKRFLTEAKLSEQIRKDVCSAGETVLRKQLSNNTIGGFNGFNKRKQEGINRSTFKKGGGYRVPGSADCITDREDKISNRAFQG